MNIDEARALMAAVANRAQPKPQLFPATVQGRNGSVCQVLVDGDPAGGSIECETLLPDVSYGERVMVMFDPPRGVYVVGRVRQPSVAGMLVASAVRTSDINGITGAEVDMPDLTVTFDSAGNRLYRVEAWARAVGDVGTGEAVFRIAYGDNTSIEATTRNQGSGARWTFYVLSFIAPDEGFTTVKVRAGSVTSVWRIIPSPNAWLAVTDVGPRPGIPE